MSRVWEPIENAPKDRAIIVAGGTYSYKKEADRYSDRGWRNVAWDGRGWKHATIHNRYEHPLWWIDALPPVPGNPAKTAKTDKTDPAAASPRNPREE
jgi:hypothetical protein